MYYIHQLFTIVNSEVQNIDIKLLDEQRQH